MKKLAYWIPLFVLLTDCEEIVDFTGKVPASKMVLTTIIECGKDTSTLVLSESWFIFSNESPEGIWEPSIRVEVDGKKSGDIFHEFSSVRQSRYQYEAAVRSGNKIRVEVETEEFGRVSGEDVAPDPPRILSVDTIRFTDTDSGIPYMRTLIKIKDNKDQADYYRLHITRHYVRNKGTAQEYTDIQKGFFIHQDVTMSALFSGQVQDEEKNLLRIFPDDLFNGKEYTVNVYFPLFITGESSYMVIELQALSEPLYRYLRSLEASWSSDTFAEPVKLYSNIEGSYGVVGVCNTTRWVIPF
ncbi:MAG: DUF4249 domain-containing protein [Bacteroides sp.]|nr:DUF4249 domain-containing protein [Bacteroides sp.]